jgi:hypothetical protein
VPVGGIDLSQNFSQFEELRGLAYFESLSTGFDTAAAQFHPQLMTPTQ